MNKLSLADLLLSASLLAPTVVFAESYHDVSEDHWAKTSIDTLTDRGTISGYEDRTFQPNEPVKRIQAAAILVKELGLERQNDQIPEFDDISKDFPQKDVVAIMEDTGII